MNLPWSSSVNEVVRSLKHAESPPREEGWLRHQENFGVAHLSAAGGVVAHTDNWFVSDDFFLMAAPYRACAGSARRPLHQRQLRPIFLMSRPPVLTRRGIPGFPSR